MEGEYLTLLDGPKKNNNNQLSERPEWSVGCVCGFLGLDSLSKDALFSFIHSRLPNSCTKSSESKQGGGKGTKKKEKGEGKNKSRIYQIGNHMEGFRRNMVKIMMTWQ